MITTVEFGVGIVLLLSTVLNIVIPVSGTGTITPLLAVLTEPHKALALAGFFYFLSAVVRAWIFRASLRPEFLRRLLPVSLAGALLGALLLTAIDPKLLAIVILIFAVHFLIVKIRDLMGKKKTKPAGKLSGGIIGAFSGFLQGAGLSGSDLRNGYLYANGLTLMEVHATTAIIGGTNFLVATLVRLETHQVALRDLLVVLWLLPIIVVGSWLGKRALLRIDRRYADAIILSIMVVTVGLLAWKILGS